MSAHLLVTMLISVLSFASAILTAPTIGSHLYRRRIRRAEAAALTKADER